MERKGATSSQRWRLHGGDIAGKSSNHSLGRRFSGLVAIQPEHRLMTGGLYGVIRHPSYLGLFVLMLGWGLTFRSGVGVVIAVLSLVVVLARIGSEERLLSETFGPEYEAYRSRTRRLIPYIY